MIFEEQIKVKYSEMDYKLALKHQKIWAGFCSNTEWNLMTILYPYMI